MKLEVRHRMLNVLRSEQEAVNAAFSEEIPVKCLDDFERDLARPVEMIERVHISWFNQWLDNFARSIYTCIDNRRHLSGYLQRR